MGSFSAELLKSKFFIDPMNIGTQLTTGEISCTILPDFPQAKYDSIQHIAVPGLIMTYDYPLKGNVTISVERVTEANYFNINNARAVLPIKQEEPISINVAEVVNLCGKELNCERGYYSKTMNNKGTESYSLKEYLIVYNCIGWALGIRDWISPSTQKCSMNLNKSLGCFANLTQDFLNIISTKYSVNSEKKSFVQEDIISKLNKTAYCSEQIPNTNLLNKEGTVAFYFKDGVMTHAARFVNNLENHTISKWVSKLGHDIMIAHTLEDLAGGNRSLYGDPLCYAIPIVQEYNCTVNELGGCINEIQIREA